MKWSSWGVHYLLDHLASGVDPIPRFERVVLLQVDPDRAVHILHSLLSVPVDLYSTAQRLFEFRGELPHKGLPPVVEFPVDAFGVRRSVRAVLREDHIIHLEGVSPSACQATPYERVGKASEGGCDLACQGLTFVTPDGATRLLNTSCNIAEVGQLLFPILVGWAPPFEETLDWLQFAYTADMTGAYVAPETTILAPSAVSEEDPLFTAI